MPWVLALIFCVSGAAGLVYEVAWVRMLANALGASSYVVGTVLAAFMGGLALGARLVGKRADRSANPLATYAKLELGVALCAIATPFAFAILPAASRLLYPILEGHLTVLTAVRCLLAFAVLIVPTALMGATFPAMASTAAADGKRGWRIGLIYGANTLGAVGGVFLAGFYLIGHVGLRNTTWIAAGANLLAAGAAWWLSGSIRPRTEIPEEPSSPDAEIAPLAEQRLALAAAAAAGFVSLGFEVLWTRMFSVLFASITYSFSMMLAVFLFGLAVGAPFFGRVADWKRSRLELIGMLQMLIAVAALAAILVFPFLKTTTGTSALAFGGPRWGEYLRSLAGDAAKVMLIPALLMGGVLPIATRVLAQGPLDSLAGRLGRVYAWNTAGAMAGSLVTGFVLIPLCGNFSVVSLILALVAAASGAFLVFRGGRWPARDRWAAVGAAAVAVALVASQAPYHKRVLLEKAIMGRPDTTRIWYEEGPSLTVAVVEEGKDHDRTMYTDAFRVAGTGPTYEYMRMIAHLPMLLRPEAKSACVVGLGTGTTAGSLSLWPLEHLDIVELCPEVARATRFFERVNHGLMDRIGKDPRLRLVFDDGKAYLRSTRHTYDVIVAEPLNPHMSGAASLYSKEFYEAARARLNPDGVVTQWIPLHGVKSEDFRALFHTFTEVFPESAVWYFKEAILLTGHAGRFAVRYVPLKAALDRPQIQAEMIPINLEDPYTLLGSFVCGPQSVKTYARYAEVITDDLPTIEYFKPGRPVSFAERENLDGLAQHREPILPWVNFTGLDPKLQNAQEHYFSVVSKNHYMARGELIQARLLEMDAERAVAAGDRAGASQLWRAAKEKLTGAANMAPLDGYVRAHLKRYDPPAGPEKEMVEMTPERKEKILEWSKGGVEDRMRACQWLWRIADWRAGKIAERLLADPDENVRKEAARALGPMGRSEALDPERAGSGVLDCGELLVNALKRSRESDAVKIQCIDSLMQVGPAGARMLIAVFSGSENPDIRVAIVAALRDLGTPESIGYLILCIHDADVRVRGEAVVALANSHDPAAVLALLDALKDTFPAIRSAAAEGLKLITGIGKEWKEDAPPEVRGACALAWERWYDDFERQKTWAGDCGRMTHIELEKWIEEKLATRGAPEKTAWAKALARLQNFRDPVKTPVPTPAALLSPDTDEVLKLVLDDPQLWLAIVIYEQKIAMYRGVSPPERISAPKR